MMLRQLNVPQDILYICETLRRGGHQAYVVGGGVRDALLGRSPKDWDVATDAQPTRVQQLFPKTVATGIEFGTVTVLIETDEREPDPSAGMVSESPEHTDVARPTAPRAVEVTTFRGESGYVDGRHPDTVQFVARIEDDLVRRDFTVNAIAYDPDQDLVVDPYGGRADLERRFIRAVGNPDERFQEDGLRVLRAVRIAIELGFSIEKTTARALRRHGARLERISRERIGQEWHRILEAADAGRGLSLLHELALLPFVLPTPPADAPSSGAVARTAAALNRGWDRDVAAKTAIVLYGLGTPDLHKRWLKLLVYPKRAAKTALHVVDVMRSFDPAALPDDPSLRRFLRRLGREYVMPFFDAWIAWHPGEDAFRLRERALDVVARGDALATDELAINGHDVQSLLALSSGPGVGEMLERLLEHVLIHPDENTRERLTEILNEWRKRDPDNP